MEKNKKNASAPEETNEILPNETINPSVQELILTEEPVSPIKPEAVAEIEEVPSSQHLPAEEPVIPQTPETPDENTATGELESEPLETVVEETVIAESETETPVEEEAVAAEAEPETPVLEEVVVAEAEPETPVLEEVVVAEAEPETPVLE
ncbi:MAG: hypothetical protein NTU44_11445, partial [Bacteroidetes bacterium]|nr:hypothetical protein [Bacteroidota bacterium]